jgi:2'-5' RNA ligase
MFDSDNYQVLKIEVSSPELVKLHNLIKDNVDNTQTHAKYNPHLTIGYLKKGKSDDFIGCMDFDGESFPVSKYCFSNKDGSDEVIRI